LNPLGLIRRAVAAVRSGGGDRSFTAAGPAEKEYSLVTETQTTTLAEIIQDLESGIMGVESILASIRKRLEYAKTFIPQEAQLPNLPEITARESIKEIREKAYGTGFGGVLNGHLFEVEPAPISTEQALVEMDRIVKDVAKRMNDLHPPLRKCGGQRVRQLLKGLIRRNNIKTNQIAFYLGEIERRHRGWCASDQWTHDGGQFAPYLDVWLNYAKERYLIEPPSAENGLGLPVD
jgi:hypothetical protein